LTNPIWRGIISTTKGKNKEETTMKMTMKELAKKYYWITLADLWDELCNDLPMYYSDEDVAEEFAKKYNVEVAEVMEYFF
jgi:hypothetical protein